MIRAATKALALAQAGGALERWHARIEWGGLPSGGPALVALLGGAAVLALMVTLYRRERPVAGARLRWVCLALRLLALGLVAVILLRPSLVRERERIIPGRTVLLADRSASMSVRDSRWPAGAGESWARALGLPGADALAALSRHQALRAVLSGGRGALFTELRRRNRVELITFADGTERLMELPRGDGETGGGEAPVDLPAWRPDGPATDLAGALRRALEPDATTGAPPAAVVVLSDGRRTAGADPEPVARQAGRLGVPIDFVAIGSALAAPNVSVAELTAPPDALVGLPLTLHLAIAASGYPGRTVQLVLNATALDDGTSREVARRSVAVGQGGGRVAVELTDVPERAGRIRYTVRVEPVDGESRTDDNAAWCEVHVSAERIGVLIVAGGPSREYRFLRALLDRSPAFDVVACLPAGSGEAGRPAPGDRPGLLAFDVVLLCDPAPSQVAPGWLNLLAELVDREGLGLAFIAGPTYTPDLAVRAGYERLRDLLPVAVDEGAARSLIGSGGYFTQVRPVGVAASGAGHPILAVERPEFWRALPGVYWLLPASRVKRGATPLLSVAAAPSAGAGEPLVAVQRYGLGRVFYCGSPETWRWRQNGVEPYARFWLTALRYCAGGRAGGNRRAEIALDRRNYSVGDPVRISARFLSDRLEPVAARTVELRVEREGRDAGKVTLRQVGAEPGRYEGVFYPDQAGRFELVYTAPDGFRRSEAFEVKPSQVEFEDTRADLALMRRLATLSGGRCFGPEELKELADAIPDRGRTVIESSPPQPLWATPYLLALFIATLAAEWVLRKRMGLL